MPDNPEYEKQHFIDLLEVSAGHPLEVVKIMEGAMKIEIASRLGIAAQADERSDNAELSDRQIRAVSTLKSYVSFIAEKGILMPEQLGLALDSPRDELDGQSPLDHILPPLERGATRDQTLADLSLREFHNTFLRPGGPS